MRAVFNPSLSLPGQSLPRHHRFPLKKADIGRWLDTLPKANLKATSEQLIVAIDELNQVDCGARKRMRCLETLRPAVHYAIRGMSQLYLRQPALLPDTAKRIASLCSDLNAVLCTGYSLVVVHLDNSRYVPFRRRLISTALHRAFSEQSQKLLRQLQIYQQEEDGFWLHLHRHYYFALKHQISDRVVKDPLLGGGTVLAAYLRPMLLAVSNPYQLSQAHLEQLFERLMDWAGSVTLEADSLEKWIVSIKRESDHLSQSTFIFNPSEDCPPAYRSKVEEPRGYLGIDTHRLVDELAEAAGEEGSVPTAERQFLLHVRAAIGNLSERRFERVQSNGTLTLAFGITRSHYFATGYTPFEEFLVQTEHAANVRDASDRARELAEKQAREAENAAAEEQDVEYIDYGDPDAEPASKASSPFRAQSVDILDVSARGYSVSVPQQEAARLQNGELVCLRESDDEPWSLGLIRWVRQEREHYYDAGIEIISLNPEPCQGRTDDRGRPRRAFILPRDTLTGEPQRFLAEAGEFRVGDTVEVADNWARRRIRLTAETGKVSDYTTFEFKPPS